MRKFKKFMGAALAAAMTVSCLTGCGSKDEGDKQTNASPTGEAKPTEETKPTEGAEPTKAETEPTKEATPEPTKEAERDLGGKTIIIGNWWANSDDMTPTTSYEEALVAYREEIQKKYNCTIKEVNLCGWNEMQELCSTSVMAGTPEASIFVLDSSFVAALISQGLFYDISTLPSYDPADEKWNKLVTNAMTFNGKTYGFATSYEPRSGIFFNKRLFEEAGLDPELPYDLQKSGEWTWEKFEEICKKLTRDIDNDGIVDTYALATFSVDFLRATIYSNNAKYVGKDESGMFYNATNEPNFLEALQFGRKLNDEGYIMPQPADSEWDWFKAAFHDGQAAMRVTEEYAKGEIKDMEDDWGFVLFPAGPHGALNPIYRENVLVIPSCYSEEEADDILFAYMKWSDPVPGYEDDDNWKLAYYPAYRDERAVDETLEIMHKGENGVLALEAYISGLETGDIAYNIWNQESTPAELIEKVQQSWNALIADANAAMK